MPIRLLDGTAGGPHRLVDATRRVGALRTCPRLGVLANFLGMEIGEHLIADVLDGNGRVLSGQAVKWSSSDPSVVRVDPTTGALKARRKAGPAVITAEYDGIVRRLRVTVT